MLSWNIHGLTGVFATSADTSFSVPVGGDTPARKPSNLAVRAAIKRKRLAQTTTKPHDKKPS